MLQLWANETFKKKKNTHFIGLAGMTGENAFSVSWAPCGIVALTKKNKINL